MVAMFNKRRVERERQLTPRCHGDREITEARSDVAKLPSLLSRNVQLVYYHTVRKSLHYRVSSLFTLFLLGKRFIDSFYELNCDIGISQWIIFSILNIRTSMNFVELNKLQYSSIEH